MGGELLRESLVRHVGLRYDQQSRRVLVDAVDDARTRNAADPGKRTTAMVKKRVDQSAIPVPCSWMDDQSRRLVHDKEMRVLEDDRDRDVLRLVVGRRWLGDLEPEAFSSSDFHRRVAQRRLAGLELPVADQGFQPLSRKGRNRGGKRAVEPPAGMTRFERHLDCLRSPHRHDIVSLQQPFKAAPPCASARTGPFTRRMNSVDFASLLCSRLCHDLMSPVGALNNGIELLADEQDPDMRDRCMELLSDSARVTANKLKFFRLAFGAAGGFGEAVDSNEAKAALEGLLGGDGKIELGWMVGDAKLSKSATKLLLNLALIATDALVRGGRLDVGAENDNGTEIAIRAEGPRIVIDSAIRDTLLSDVTGNVEPRTAGAWLANSLASEANGSIQVSQPSEEILVIGAYLPEQALR